MSNSETYTVSKVVDFGEMIDIVTSLASNGYDITSSDTNFECEVDNVTLCCTRSHYDSRFFTLTFCVEINLDEVIESTLGVSL